MIGYYTQFSLNMIAVAGMLVFSTILWPSYALNEDYEPGKQDLEVGMNVGAWLQLSITITAMHCFISFAGYNYVESEVPRVANEKLLHNLDQGVFIMDESDGSLLF